jgi:hypothetical protein
MIDNKKFVANNPRLISNFFEIIISLIFYKIRKNEIQFLVFNFMITNIKILKLFSTIHKLNTKLHFNFIIKFSVKI